MQSTVLRNLWQNAGDVDLRAEISLSDWEPHDELATSSSRCLLVCLPCACFHPHVRAPCPVPASEHTWMNGRKWVVRERDRGSASYGGLEVSQGCSIWIVYFLPLGAGEEEMLLLARPPTLSVELPGRCLLG